MYTLVETIDLPTDSVTRELPQSWKLGQLNLQWIWIDGDRSGIQLPYSGEPPTEIVYRGLDLTVLTPDD